MTHPTGLNGPQALHVVSTFRYVDQLLASVERAARGDLSPLAPEHADVAPHEGRLVMASVAAARRRMLDALDRLKIPRPQQRVSARWSIHTALKFAETSLSELDERKLRAYGAADPATARQLEALAADLTAILQRAVALLHEREAGGLAAQLARVRGPAARVLMALERLSTEHGLAEVRPLIAAAAERALASTLDVGVFGRVSSGKSSLINALAGTSVLPVGATPATAVPLRVGRGTLGAEIHLLDDTHRQLAIEEIATYATEEQNPENRRGVRAIEIKAPTVPEGLRFLDTPGVGSLTTSGPAQAFAWLPRCDLGLVLVAAGGPVGPDDVALVAGLTHAGIASRVLLSKSDLLPPDERDHAVSYVARELVAALGPAVQPVIYAVSTLPAYRHELEVIRRDVLEPLAADHVRAAHDALRTRLHRLVAATSASLQGRRLEPDHSQLVTLHSARVAATDRIEQEVQQLSGESARTLEQASDVLAGAWARGENGAAHLQAVIQQVASRALVAVREAADSGRAPGSPAGDSHRVPPIFDPEFLSGLPNLAAPRLGRRLAGRLLAGRRLQPVAPALREALDRYAMRLRAWGIARLMDSPDALWPDDQTAAQPENGALAELDALIDTEQTPEGGP